MITASEQLDRRFSKIAPFVEGARRPSHGWIRAIRDALGMTTKQLARRMGVTQPRISELERAETKGNITLHSLERAAEAMRCRLVYALVPVKPLTEQMMDRARIIAGDHLAAVSQSMLLEDQHVSTLPAHAAREKIYAELFRRPARLWDQV
jgi:predicted DNA-binding mobile mystery protein A